MVCGQRGEDDWEFLHVFDPPGECGELEEGDTTETKEFAFTGSDQTFTVPAGIKCIMVFVWGAGGGGGGTNDGGCCGGDGGGGGAVEAQIETTPGNILTIMVGEGMGWQANKHGYGGGATGGGRSNQRKGGSGGGFSRINRGGTVLVVAGGGGGGNSRYVTGPEGSATGGAGGGQVGLKPEGDQTKPNGGSQTAGGSRGTGLMANPGACFDSQNGEQWQGGFALGYNGCDCSYGCPGGGGGGYYGGGGGSGGKSNTIAQGGAGGSSFVNTDGGVVVYKHHSGIGKLPGLMSSPHRGNAGEGGDKRSDKSTTPGKHGKVVIMY